MIPTLVFHSSIVASQSFHPHTIGRHCRLFYIYNWYKVFLQRFCLNRDLKLILLIILIFNSMMKFDKDDQSNH